MRNFLLTIEYDGTMFHGWQKQPGKRTAQGVLEEVLSCVCRAEVAVNAVSRTDAGVHAYGQRAGFRGDFLIPPDRLMIAANHILLGGKSPAGRTGDMRLRAAEIMPETFHVRFDAVGKKYIYRMLSSPEPDIFLRNRYWQTAELPDIEMMSAAAEYIKGAHDFKAFQAAGGNLRETTVRTVYGLMVYAERTEAGIISTVEVTGDGFLYNMVRIIAGTLYMVGTGRMNPEDIEKILESGERKNAGYTAPSQGLYLAEVYYDKAEMERAAAMRFEG
ncbi:MAG: tRNA pseudouridine(38-40) synthase TruA [Clostridiales Family XIII bacterium]|jgi:tRNA pseudouridine38-40 synthase|nr:tRNA pseudouridine(38-40) synthase TruA [Clostridiales Family XIII bacterium]